MKKITLLFMFIGMITLQSCTVNEDTDNFDNDTISEVWEYNQNVNFIPNNNFSVLLPFQHSIFPSDMVLVYRLSDFDNGNDVWKLMPETYYFADGTLDFGYTNDFTQNNALVQMIGNDLLSLPADLRLNQVIRIVVVPGFFGNKGTEIDFSNYDETIEKLGLTNKPIKKISL
ncbi:hypothetical protein [Flavobacterium dankookense]|uniref:Uncharacterized protein n=1 Tax=Flavobacterium dankookense TaxID=706186 RepID=A0A4R6QAC4_9FLAO|nr:hypothetical protein [Flavobacterium dankookense]TDP59301.1 hypothetical protein BC748_1548 [Flavobacterium dankookense]